MKRECGQETCLAQTKSDIGANRFTRAFGLLPRLSANIPHSLASRKTDEDTEDVQTFQIEAEQKRALGMASYRRDILR